MARHIANTAARLQERLAQLSSTVQLYLEDQIPELRGDARVMELHGPSVEGNVNTLLHALRYNIAVERVEAPTAALEYARRLAQHGVPLHALVRAYRLGQHRMNELVFAEVRTIDVPEPARYAVLEAMTATLFQYIDWITQQVIVVYEDERERWLEDQNSLRAVRVRDLLEAPNPVDVDEATTALRYPMRWHHLAVVMWYPDTGTNAGAIAGLQRFLRELGQATGAAATPLFVADDRTCAWGWLPYRTATPAAEAEVRRFTAGKRDAPDIAIGTMCSGVAGFQKSHREAARARRVAVIAEGAEPTLICASDPGLAVAALLGADVTDTRAWVAGTLGTLAADTDNDALLRETLRVYFGCGSSYKQAAEELNLHFNTVKYRVGRAIARRGRRIGTDRLDIELALLACHWYGAAVLLPK
jgi:DNA-binding PucR family transcriptional regulator